MSRFLTTNRNIELLEPYEGKLSCTVLRGEGGSNALDLPDIQKQGDFFVESPIILLASIIWYLKRCIIATARSNKVAVCLGFQDFSQLERDYGKPEAAVVMNTVGNIFSGQVVGSTAKTLSERFGKVLQKRQSISINRQDVSTSINTQLDSLIPASKISTLTQGIFVGAISDNFGQRIEQKIFHAEIVVDSDKVVAEEKDYKPIPIINPFIDENGKDYMDEAIQSNYRSIKEQVKTIVRNEKMRIAADPSLRHLLTLK